MRSLPIDVEARKFVRARLLKYKMYQQEINTLRQAILFPHQETDENIGGGRSSLNNFETEAKAIKLVSNKQIQVRSEFIAVVNSVLSECSEEANKIIEMRYFGKQKESWAKISVEVKGYTEYGCRKIEKKVVDRIAERLGW